MFATLDYLDFYSTFNYIKPLFKEYYHDCTAGRKTILDELNTFRLPASIDSGVLISVFEFAFSNRLLGAFLGLLILSGGVLEKQATVQLASTSANVAKKLRKDLFVQGK